MKRLIVILFLSCMVFQCNGQGDVIFGNLPLLGVSSHDVLVRNVDGFPLVGTNWCAQLYYGQDQSSLAPTLAVPRRFRDGTEFPPGVWSTASRNLTGFSPGDTVILQVVAWDCALFTTYEAAVLANGIRGQSAPFAYVIPTPGSPLSSYYMENFRGFTLVPEPGAFVLLAVFGGVLLLRLRGAGRPR
jgi:hypothetical protein